VEAARSAVNAAKFPPLGKRSFGPYRAAQYSFGVSEYMPRADELSTLIVQVESEDAARNVDGILSVPGIDAVFMGPNDLAFSMLREGESFFGGGFGSSGVSRGVEGANQWTGFARTPEVISLCEEVLEKCKAAGLPFGMTSASIQEAREWLAKGANFMTFGSDFLFMRAGARYMSQPPDTAKP
ncbi:MAG TPA: aldolase/citrate lyase family protein, partial [Bryobacteraceae bacterium]|nr:aldolase/citrate lyase family protein [Bryobacteraceae bacterium]